MKLVCWICWINNIGIKFPLDLLDRIRTQPPLHRTTEDSKFPSWSAADCRLAQLNPAERSAPVSTSPSRCRRHRLVDTPRGLVDTPSSNGLGVSVENENVFDIVRRRAQGYVRVHRLETSSDESEVQVNRTMDQWFCIPRVDGSLETRNQKPNV
nr:hypothetical protein Iba_chr04fCG8600 [Ipomoea batatas]GME01896.1 hypothetical protein Iba_contig3177CG0010 [Ipomoea batatas]